MAKLIIEGGHQLDGGITIAGNKNAVLPIMAASILTDKKVILKGVPKIRDVFTMSAILKKIGAKIDLSDDNCLQIDCFKISSQEPDRKLVSDLRASILLLGPMLARFGRLTLHHPGGDIIGRRSIDAHLTLFQKLGVEIQKQGLKYILKTSRPMSRQIFLQEASVTATENALMFAAALKGVTTIKNAACEPHVIDLCHFLEKIGAKISGVGGHTLSVDGGWTAW